MVGGTKLPPQDSQSEPGCYERKTRSKTRTQLKTLYEGKRQKPSQVYVSLDNADTVIEGAPSRLLFNSRSQFGNSAPAPQTAAHGVSRRAMRLAAQAQPVRQDTNGDPARAPCS